MQLQSYAKSLRHRLDQNHGSTLLESELCKCHFIDFALASWLHARSTFLAIAMTDRMRTYRLTARSETSFVGIHAQSMHGCVSCTGFMTARWEHLPCNLRVAGYDLNQQCAIIAGQLQGFAREVIRGQQLDPIASRLTSLTTHQAPWGREQRVSGMVEPKSLRNQSSLTPCVCMTARMMTYSPDRDG